jgi:hypothetical protein
VRAAQVTFVAAPGLADKAAELAPQVDAALREISTDLVGLPPLEHVEVRLVLHTDDMTAAAPPGATAPDWAAGVAFPEAGVVVIAARDSNGQLIDMRATLIHELAHMALDHALGEAHIPRWLHEGFAYRHSTEWSWEQTQTLASALWRGDLMPIGALEYAFPARHDAVSQAYAQSYDFVEFLANRGRWADSNDDGDPYAFRRFLALMAQHYSVDAALNEAFGRNLGQLEVEWLEGLRSRYMWYPAAAIGSMFWVVLAVLAIYGWMRRRREGRARLVVMAAEEEAALERARVAALFELAQAGMVGASSGSAAGASPPVVDIDTRWN